MSDTAAEALEPQTGQSSKNKEIELVKKPNPLYFLAAGGEANEDAGPTVRKRADSAPTKDVDWVESPPEESKCPIGRTYWEKEDIIRNTGYTKEKVSRAADLYKARPFLRPATRSGLVATVSFYHVHTNLSVDIT